MKLPELEELYRRYRMDLYRYLCFLTHDPVQAEDLLSETFVRVIKRLPTFRGECEVKTWLFGIARNIWLESLRRRHQSVSLDDLMERYITDDALTETTAARLPWLLIGMIGGLGNSVILGGLGRFRPRGGKAAPHFRNFWRVTVCAGCAFTICVTAAASFASLSEDMIFTLFSSHVMFLLFSNIPCITLAAAGAQLPFSMRPMVRFW